MWRLISPLALMLAAFLSPAHAEQAERFGNYIAHYNAFTSDVLDPKVASSYGIQRSHNRAVLMVNVQRAGAMPAGIRAKVDASAQNLSLQSRAITVREVKDGDVYYYLADFPVNNGETLDFTISVQPEGATAPHEFTYRQQFFTRAPR